MSEHPKKGYSDFKALLLVGLMLFACLGGGFASGFYAGQVSTTTLNTWDGSWLTTPYVNATTGMYSEGSLYLGSTADTRLYRSGTDTVSLGAGDSLIGAHWLNSTNIHATTEIYRGTESLTDLLAAAGGGSLTKQASAFTYIGWKDGATYYANSTTGGTSYSGTNVTVVFQNALTAMTTGGGLFIKAGSYILKGLQPNSNTTIWGEGPATKLIMPTGQYDDQGHIGHENLNIFYIESKTNIEIAYMELDGSQEAYPIYNTAPCHNYNGIRTENSSFLAFHHLWIHDVRRSGILIRGYYHEFPSVYVEIYNCYFENCNWDGPELAACADFNVHNCWITGTSDVCFAVWEGRRGVFKNINGWAGNRNMGSTDGHNCMSYDGAGDAGYENSEIIVESCIFDDFDGAAILILNGSHHSRLTGCTLTNIRGEAIWSNSHNINNFIIESNIFRLVGISNEKMFAIDGGPTLSEDVIIRDNIIDGTGNNISNVIGMYLVDLNRTLIQGNIFKNINAKGLALANCNNTRVDHNTFVNCTWITLIFYGNVNNFYFTNNLVRKADVFLRLDEATPAPTNLHFLDNDLKYSSLMYGSFPATTYLRGNTKLITENSGTGSIALHAKTATITHGLAVTPSAGNIHITWTSSLTNCTSWSITGITSSVFVVNLYDNTGVAKGPSSTVSFAWDYAKTP